jgi:hypothetical protein
VSPRPALVQTAHEPLLVTVPAGTRAAVVLVHGPGETRAGTNFVLSELGRRLVGSFFAVARFDLAGCGESRAEPSVARWRAQLEEAAALTARVADAETVHLVARGAHAALLPQRWEPGRRVALSPSRAADLRTLATEADGRGLVAGVLPAPARVLRLWAAIGAEPKLAGGLELPAALLLGLADALEQERWDVALRPVDDPLALRETTRAASAAELAVLLAA